MAGAAVLLHVPAAVLDQAALRDRAAPRRGEGRNRPLAACDGERRGDRARRRAVDPDRAMGIRRGARLLALTDPLDGDPAAVPPAHDPALDEPLRDPYDVDAADLDRR